MSEPIPRGIEVLVKKASVDPGFRELLLRDRAAAAETIGLSLDPAETAMLAAIAADQLEAIIARTTVPSEQRRVFLGKTAAAMFTALGVGVILCCGVMSAGCSARREMNDEQPDWPEEEGGDERHDRPSPTGGVGTGGATRGIRPDRPEPKQP